MRDKKKKSINFIRDKYFEIYLFNSIILAGYVKEEQRTVKLLTLAYLN